MFALDNSTKTLGQLSVVIAALAFATAVHGQAVAVEVHPALMETYDVHGRDIAEVASRLGSGHVASTRWRVTWKYTLEESGSCRLKSFRVDVTAKIRMPRWANRDASPPKARASWDAFNDAMRKHEEGHRDHGVRAGRELARQIRTLGSRSDCRRLRADVDMTGDRVIATFQAEDNEYDRVTRHGISQGAILRF
jgi:predicted secreted Zn-dependent protease